ncbi:hypothetical protein QD47_17425 [Paenibacillus terrae]|uniref:RNA polymerase sigma-70 region 4 domain-containing protein n=1 Tax=Paenibacillus terrae TaxID=159743 RepID=A0A0D7X005_9BACL|nr:hypothetical protein QD47_17425 [Paenibacillus terrae]
MFHPVLFLLLLDSMDTFSIKQTSNIHFSEEARKETAIIQRTCTFRYIRTKKSKKHSFWPERLLGISRSYVSRIEKRALMKLYHELYKQKG